MVGDALFDDVIEIGERAPEVWSEAIRRVAIRWIRQTCGLNENPIEFGFADKLNRAVDLIRRDEAFARAFV